MCYESEYGCSGCFFMPLFNALEALMYQNQHSDVRIKVQELAG
jgi:hypothetical protein